MSLVSTALFLLLFGGGRSDTRVSNSGRVFPWTQCDGEVLLIERDDDYYKVKPEAETTTTTAHTLSLVFLCVCACCYCSMSEVLGLIHYAYLVRHQSTLLYDPTPN